jgi:BTB/POZ domain
VLFARIRGDFATATNNWTNELNDTSSLPLSASQLLANFRLCPENDRMTFVCSDGVRINAHRSVLSLYSPVFKAYFEGPWSATHPDGEWETIYPSKLINAILDFMYSGKTKTQLLLRNRNMFYTVAQEFQLTSLADIARDCMISSLGFGNIKSTLEIAFLHKDEDLRDTCYDFIESNLEDVILDPAFACLAAEKPDLWEDMCRYLRPDKPYKKYSPMDCNKRTCNDKEEPSTDKPSQSDSTAKGCSTKEGSSVEA